MNLATKRSGRGKGSKLARTHVNLRLPVYVLDYFRKFPNYTTEMRRVLETHVIMDTEQVFVDAPTE